MPQYTFITQRCTLSIFDILPDIVINLIFNFLRWLPCLHRPIHPYIVKWNSMQQDHYCAKLFFDPIAYYVIKEQYDLSENCAISQALTPQFIFGKNSRKIGH